jgi:hypothetical protein
MPVTPFRKTIVTFDVDEVTLGLQSWTLQRKSTEIRPVKRAGELTGADVFCPGGDAWIMRPQFHEAAQALKETVGGYVLAADVELAFGYTSFNAFRARTDLPNIGTGASVTASGAPAFKKRVAAGDDWDLAQLTDDAAAYPPPTPDTEPIYPQDRVLSGLVTYPTNTPFMVNLFTPEGFAGTDAFFTFYFGGETETVPDGTSGGSFCIVLRGGGDATLYERDEIVGEWVVRQEFFWNEPGVAPGGLGKCLAVIPYAARRIWIAGNMATPYSTGGFTLLGALVSTLAAGVAAEPSAGNKTLYREALAEIGHLHTTYTTGEGTVRVDMRRDMTNPFSLLRGVYPEEGLLIDSPFEVNRILPGGSTITVKLYGYQYPNTDVTVQLYNAADGTALTTDGNGNFLSVAGQRKYFAAFTFTSDDGIGTPVLYGYTVDITGVYSTRSGANTQALVHGVSITGPDIEPTHDEASVSIKDPTNLLSLLRTRDGIRSRISVYHNVSGALVSHLFEGETCQPKAQLRGMAGDRYPGANWYDYQIRFSGLYPRLEEQFHDAPPFSFASSEDSPNPLPDPASDGGWAPWLVTDVIRWLLNHAGFRGDELDIPDYPLRLWPSPGIASDAYAIQPGTTYGRLAADLIRNLLGAVFVRDPNAGARGLWRILPVPYLTSANYLWRFNLDAPPSAGKLVHYQGAHGSTTSFILKDSYHSYVKKPEGNVVTVYGVSDGTGSATGSNLIQAQLINFASLLDTGSPDYLGRPVPITRGADPFLVTQEACNWVAFRIYEQAARAQKWFEWVAPLALVTDPIDLLQVRLRPLRINDLVYLRRDGIDVPVIIRSVNPDWTGTDERQMAFYEAKLFE